MANVTVDASAEIKAGARTQIRSGNDFVYSFVNDGGTIRANKGNVAGEPATFAEQDGGGPNQPSNTDFLGVAVARRSDGIVDVVWYDNDSAAHGASPAIMHAQFSCEDAAANQDTWSLAPEDVSSVIDGPGGFSIRETLGVAVDGNNDPHVTYSDAEILMGTNRLSFYYVNKIGGTWNAKVLVRIESALFAVGHVDIMIASPTDAIGADRPILALNGGDNLNMFHGDTLNATSFTEESDVTGAIALDQTVSVDVRNISMVIDSTGRIVIAFTEDGSSDLMIIEHLASNNWATWETPVDVDTARNYVSVSLAANNTNLYILTESEDDDDLRLFKNEVAESIETYFFDGSDGPPVDPDSVWTNDTNAEDGSTSTFAHTTSTGLPSSNELQLNGTNTPSGVGDQQIKSVRFRIFGVTLAGGRINSEIRLDGGGEEVGNPVNEEDPTPAWGPFIDATKPTGGWTFTKLQGLEVKFWEDIGNGSDETRVYRVEVEVTLHTWLEETADPDLPNVGTFNLPSLKWASKNLVSPAELDYVFEDSGGAVLYNTFSVAAAVIVKIADEILDHVDTGFAITGPVKIGNDILEHIDSGLKVLGVVKIGSDILDHIETAISKVELRRIANEILEHVETPVRVLALVRIGSDILDHIESALAIIPGALIKTADEILDHVETTVRALGIVKIANEVLDHIETAVKALGIVKIADEIKDIVESALSIIPTVAAAARKNLIRKIRSMDKG